MKKKTKLQILSETIKYYSADSSRRGIGIYGICEYYSSDGKKCAVGRCAKHPSKLPHGAIDCLLDDSYEHELSDKKIFKPEYQGHEVEFWSDLQVFHDTSENWTKKSISAKGKKKVESLKKKWAKKCK